MSSSSQDQGMRTMHRINGQTIAHRGSKKSPALLAGVALGAVVAVSGPAIAQAPMPADLDRLLAVIETQQQQIDALRAEVDAMKSAQARAGPRSRGNARAGHRGAGSRRRPGGRGVPPRGADGRGRVHLARSQRPLAHPLRPAQPGLQRRRRRHLDGCLHRRQRHLELALPPRRGRPARRDLGRGGHRGRGQPEQLQQRFAADAERRRLRST